MNKILLILKKELRELFRDKKSLSMMLIIPIMIPLIIIGMSYLFQSESSKDIETYNKIGLNYQISKEEEDLLKSLEIDYEIYNDEELKKEFDQKNINAYITKENNKYTIFYDESNVDSSYALSLATSYIEAYKSYLENDYLYNQNINIEEFNNLIIYESASIEQENFFANYIINYAFLFILMAISVSATYPATDTTAGEKERGTLETLLTFPIKAKDIIVGKFLSVTLSSLITGFLSLILIIFSITYITKNFDIYAGISILNYKIILTAIAIIISFSLLVSGLCIAIASMSKSFKEAQSALTPISFISFFPGMIIFLTNISNNALLSMVPFVNFSMIFTDVVNDNANILYILLMFISTIIFIVLIIHYIIKAYSSEKVLFTK